MTELWKPFPADTRYEVSTEGRVRRISTQYIRQTPVKQNGYPGIVFSYPGGKPKGYDLHTMVALTWLGPKPLGFDVSHQDGNKLNNYVSNLAYESRRENSTKSFNKFCNGFNPILTADDVQAIRKSSLTNNELAAIYKVGRMTIWKIKKNITWKWLETL